MTPSSAYLMPTYARQPVSFSRGQGARLWDAQGIEYLDAIAGVAVTGLGHAHPEIAAVIAEQAGQLLHTSNLFRIEWQERLAERLCALSGMQRAFFCNSGAEANEVALKLARLHAGGRRVTDPQVLVMEVTSPEVDGLMVRNLRLFEHYSSRIRSLVATTEPILFYAGQIFKLLAYNNKLFFDIVRYDLVAEDYLTDKTIDRRTLQKIRDEDRIEWEYRADDVAAIVADVALAPPRNGIVEIAGPERAPFNEIIARYLKAVGDRREVVRDPEARYFGGRVEERSLVPLGEARLGRIGFDEWLRRSQAKA